MPLHCSCIDMQTPAFDFLPIKCEACHRLPLWNTDCMHMVHIIHFVFSKPDIFLTVLPSFLALQFSFLCSSYVCLFW